MFNLDWIDNLAAAVWGGTIAFLIGVILATCGTALSTIWFAAFGAEMHGIASVYSSHESHSKWTASGARMIDSALTAAHRTLPLGTKVRVLHGDHAVVVRINDRGPFVKRRIIDLSPAAARAAGISGLGEVTLQVLN